MAQPYYSPTGAPPMAYPPTDNNPMGSAGYPPMAQPSHAPTTNQISVVGPQFCAPYPVDLTVMRKMMTLNEGSFQVSDVNGNIVFKVKGAMFSLRDKRVLLDAAGNPLISMRQKIISAHRRWEVYRGDGTSELLFTVKKSSLLQFKTNLDVFLAGNTRESAPDFKIKGSWFERSCVVYLGESSNIVAQMHKKHSVQSIVLGKDTFAVTVYPQIDYAFIVSLIVILNEINEDRSGED